MDEHDRKASTHGPTSHSAPGIPANEVLADSLIAAGYDDDSIAYPISNIIKQGIQRILIDPKPPFTMKQTRQSETIAVNMAMGWVR